MPLLAKSFALAGYSSKNNYSHISTNTEIFPLFAAQDGRMLMNLSFWLVFMISNQKPISNFDSVSFHLWPWLKSFLNPIHVTVWSMFEQQLHIFLGEARPKSERSSQTAELQHFKI